MECYGNMLEKYREIDEDKILSTLTEEELAQLEGEIDREVLNKAPERSVNEEEYIYSTTSDESSSQQSEAEEEEQETEGNEEDRENTCEEKERQIEKTEEKAAETRRLHFASQKQRSVNPLLERRTSIEVKRKQLNKSHHRFKVPQLRKASSREGLRRQKSEEGGELKKELMQAVNRRSKRRTSRANSSGISRRYKRSNSSNLSRRKISKTSREDKQDKAIISPSLVTEDMLAVRPTLKKVKTREPAKPHDILHGISLEHITSGAKDKYSSDIPEYKSTVKAKRAENLQDDEDSDVSEPTTDDAVTWANDNVHRSVQKQRITTSSRASFCPSDDMTSTTTAGSTSAESYDVVGELSINSNSVEDTILRVWENDERLTEVNLNNIQNVDMEVFEELACAMEHNTHVERLFLANVGLTDRPARALASMLKRNQSLQNLNIESNFITGETALKLVAALRRNTTLTELRLDNQRHIFGARVEHEFSKILKDNKTLLRFGYQFANPGPRMTSSNCLTRNMDTVRKKRVSEQRVRAQSHHAKRSPIRRQGSSEWYRREKADNTRKLKEQGISLDDRGAIQDEDVEKVLQQIHPSHMALLEQWFVSKLYGLPQHVSLNSNDLPDSLRTNVTGAGKIQENQPKIHVQSPSPSFMNHQSSIESTPIDQCDKIDVFDSIHGQPDLASMSEKRACSSPEYPRLTTDVLEWGMEEKSSLVVQEKEQLRKTERPKSPIPTEEIDDEQCTPNLDISTNTASSTTESDDFIEWQEGDEYDSDEYEIVEIEVTESESGENDGIDDISDGRNNNNSESSDLIPDEKEKMHRSSIKVETIAGLDDSVNEDDVENKTFHQTSAVYDKESLNEDTNQTASSRNSAVPSSVDSDELSTSPEHDDLTEDDFTGIRQKGFRNDETITAPDSLSSCDKYQVIIGSFDAENRTSSAASLRKSIGSSSASSKVTRGGLMSDTDRALKTGD